jgi:hypothetical protein
MNKPSKSPDRHSFQKDGYVKRQTEKGEPVNENYLDFFEKMINEHDHKFDDLETQKNNMEYDLLTTDWILEKVRSSESYAQNLYAAMCNNEFQKRDLWPILAEHTWGCSWRYAGGIISDMRQEGDYIDWYCSGMGGLAGGWDKDAETFIEWAQRTKFVSESVVTEEIRDDLFKLGWLVADNKT